MLEDHNQTCKGNAAKNLGTGRRIVLNIFKEEPGVKGRSPVSGRMSFPVFETSCSITAGIKGR
ncbi:MAG: hypothetical protein ACJAVK_002397 [Akkermansiaceae bacterium]